MVSRRIDLDKLIHRWFVQFNPLYLLSAAAVLCALTLLSADIGRRSHVWKYFLISGLAEVYQLLLIGACALLYRIRQRRPAVMLALLEVAYLGDLIMQTMSNPYLGAPGMLATAVWVAGSVGKLWLLAKALRLDVPRAARVMIALGLSGLAIFPALIVARAFDSTLLSGLVALWFLVVGLIGLHGDVALRSKDRLDPWASAVLERATLASYAIWLILLVVHAGHWAAYLTLSTSFLFALLLLPLQRVRREFAFYALIGVVLFLTAATLPAELSIVALMAAISLCVRALLPRRRTTLRAALAHPYRAPASESPRAAVAVLEPIAKPEAWRHYTLALLCLHLAVWTFGASMSFHDGLFYLVPQPGLDLALVAGLLAIFCYRRTAFALLGVGLHGLKWALWLFDLPSSRCGVALLVAAAGFGLLFVAVSINWLYYRRQTRIDAASPTAR